MQTGKIPVYDKRNWVCPSNNRRPQFCKTAQPNWWTNCTGRYRVPDRTCALRLQEKFKEKNRLFAGFRSAYGGNKETRISSLPAEVIQVNAKQGAKQSLSSGTLSGSRSLLLRVHLPSWYHYIESFGVCQAIFVKTENRVVSIENIFVRILQFSHRSAPF